MSQLSVVDNWDEMLVCVCVSLLFCLLFSVRSMSSFYWMEPMHIRIFQFLIPFYNGDESWSVTMSRPRDNEVYIQNMNRTMFSFFQVIDVHSQVFSLKASFHDNIIDIIIFFITILRVDIWIPSLGFRVMHTDVVDKGATDSHDLKGKQQDNFLVENTSKSPFPLN